MRGEGYVVGMGRGGKTGRKRATRKTKTQVGG
jgi:hypothetical protein